MLKRRTDPFARSFTECASELINRNTSKSRERYNDYKTHISVRDIIGSPTRFVETFASIFPYGCDVTEDNIKKLAADGLPLRHVLSVLIDAKAVISGCYEENDEVMFCTCGWLHREDGPALTYRTYDGTSVREWYLNGKRHREDGPAVESENGYLTEWYFEGNLHRVGGPASVRKNKDSYWYQHGNLHREDGPAIEYANGKREYFLSGKLTLTQGDPSQCVVAHS